MRIKQVFAIPETSETRAALFALSEDGVIYVAMIYPSTDINKPDWRKVTPPAADIAESDWRFPQCLY